MRTPWALLLLGRPTLLLRPAEGDSGGGEKEPGDVTALLTGRMLELLIFLALHPHGARRDAVVAALWPDTNRRRPANNLSAIITRLRSALRNHALGNRGAHCSDAGDDLPDIVTIEGETYRINPDTVTVDYWNFLAATADPPRHQNPSADASRPTTELTDESLDTLRTAHDLYRGPLADGIGTEWILAIREATRRTFLTTSAHLVRHYATIQPETALHLLETTTRRDDVNEKLYHDIIALQLRMGDNVGADNTLRLLMALLSDIGQSPSPATADFARLIHEELAKPPHPVS